MVCMYVVRRLYAVRTIGVNTRKSKREEKEGFEGSGRRSLWRSLWTTTTKTTTNKDDNKLQVYMIVRNSAPTVPAASVPMRVLIAALGAGLGGSALSWARIAPAGYSAVCTLM